MLSDAGGCLGTAAVISLPLDRRRAWAVRAYSPHGFQPDLVESAAERDDVLLVDLPTLYEE
ncbi:hypothetical protein [Streptomyces sp. NPDC059256]|uniref:hypothetical protein n=1 Tax=Streptomyces sp. NPDC059256 TaxID=3346794 RepID=UPI0036AFBE37